jgi:branched-subunit amino acid aminotransferase/4-amino-4-deoxychorismate lyase
MPNMPESAAEGLLCASDGTLLEGLITNLFIVAGAVLSSFGPVLLCCTARVVADAIVLPGCGRVCI